MKQKLTIAFLALLCIWLRYTGLYWGSSMLTHADEARVAMGVGDIFNHLGNPKFQAYGHLPLYLQAALFKLRVWLGWLSPDHFGEMIVSGRMIAATLSLGTIYLTGRIAILLGLPFWSAWTAAFCVALFPLSVQLSQYSTVDAHITFFATWAIERAMVFKISQKLKHLVGVCACLGAAIACKASAFPLVLIVWFFLGLKWKSPRFWLVPVITLSFFALFQPYAFLDWQRFISDVVEQGRWVRGNGPPIFFHQYEDTLKFIFSIRDLFFYSVGPLAFLLAIFGFAKSLQQKQTWLLAAWFVFNWFLLGTSYAKFSRYWLPMLPIFSLYVAWALFELQKRFSPLAQRGFLFLFLLWTGLVGIAVHTVHLQIHPYRKALQYLDQKTPPNAPLAILNDSVWVGFPVVGEKVGQRPAKSENLEIFELHNDPEYAKRLAQKLSQSDYFMTLNHLSIRTAYEQIGRKWTQAQTFQALLDNKLGYKFEKVFTTQPTFLKGVLNDFLLDYSIPLYDHPSVYLWSNQGKHSAEEIEKEIQNISIPDPKGSLAAFSCLNDGNTECLTVGSLPTKPIAFLETTFGDETATLAPHFWQPMIWYLFFLFTGVACWPFAGHLFRGSLAAGYGASRLLSWVVWGYVLWLLGHLPGGLFSNISVVVSWALLMICGWIGWKRTHFLKKILSENNWQNALTLELTFLGVFILFFLFRLFAPDVYWSENPVDLSYLSLLTKTASLPPPDPGYSGTFLNYYYYGFLLFSLPAKVLSLTPNISYGLAMATVPALTANLVITLGASIGNAKPKLWMGFLSAFLVMGVGNWDGLVQVIQHHGTGGFNFFRSAHEIIQYTVHEFPLWSYLFVDLHAHILSSVLFLLFFVWLRFSDLTRLTRTQICVGAILMGSMGPSNTWDYFSCAMLLILISAHISWKQKDWRPTKPILSVLVLSYVFFAPFYLIFTKKLAQLGVGWVGNMMTDLRAALICLGMFLTFIVLDLYRTLREIPRSRSKLPLWIGLGLALFITYSLTLAFHRTPLTFLLYSLASLGAVYVVFSRSPKFPYIDADLIVFFSMLIVCMCEIFYIKDWLQGGEYKRMNTVFKFYFQVWYLLAIVSPALLWRAFRRLTTKQHQYLFLTVAGLAIAAAAVWPFGGVRARAGDHLFQKQGRFEVTFDGLSWLKHLRPHEYNVVAWLWKYGTTKDVLLEAGNGDYQYEYNVVSSASGVPTVQSWWSHTDQRDRPYSERSQLVRDFYKTTDIQRALQIMRRFHVTYVYVAEREREQYGEEGLKKFSEQTGYFRPILTFPEGALYRCDNLY